MVVGPQTCLCCGAEVEDDEHIVAGCPATGTQDLRQLVAEAWGVAAKAAAVDVPLLPEAVLVDVHFMLLGALIPAAASSNWGLPAEGASRFLAALHRGLAAAIAECLRRREELVVGAIPVAAPDSEAMVLDVEGPQHSLPLERRLSVADLRSVERRRRQGLLPRVDPALDLLGVPVAGEPRRRWLRQRLVVLLREDMLVCPPS